MTPTTGLLAAAALLLGAAGIGKTLRPGPAAVALVRARIPGRGLLARPGVVRGYGVAEVVAALVVLAVGGRTGAAVLVVAYAALVGVAARIATVARGSACGCFGGDTDRVGLAHHVVTGAGVAVGLAGLGRPADALLPAFAHTPGTAGLVLLTAAVLALAAYAVLSALPALLAGRRALVSPGGTP